VEPLSAWLGERWGIDGRRGFRYEISGADRRSIVVIRV
jgi:hypothetical protein